MKEQMKRLISLILAVVMLFGMMPMNAFATEADAPEQNGLPLDSVVWELGTIASADGQNNASTSRLRTASYLNLSEYAGVGIGRGYTMTNFVYDAEYNYLGTSSWIGNGMSFTTEALQEKYPNGVYFRVALRALDQRTLSTADIPAIGVAFYAPGETIPQPESNLKYTDVGTVGSWQDGAVYDGKLFVFGGAGTGAVYDLDSLEKLGTVTLDKKDILKPHANSVCFGSTYYAEGDQYPLLYVNIYNNYATAEDRMEGTCCVYRVTESDGVFSTDLVQVIRIGFTEDLTLWKSRENNGDVRPYGNFVVDTDRDKLYAFVMRDAEKTTRFFGFDLPDLTEGTSDDVYGCNVVTLQSTDIETQFDTVYFNYLQGCCYYDGQIVSVEGFHSGGSAEPCLRIVNLDREEVTGTFYPAEAGLNSEPEVVCVDHNSGTLYYAAADGTLRVMTLENVHLHTYESAITAPTCTEQGYTTYTCECGESYVDDYVDATGHNYENGSCTGCGEKESLQLVDGFDVVSSIQAGDSRLADAFNTVSPLIYQNLTLFENCAITSLNLFVTGTVVDNDGTNKNDPAIDDSAEYTFDISVIDASSVKAGGYYSIKETYTLRVPGSEIKKNDWNTFDVSQLGITVDEGETLGFGSSASTLEIFYLNKCASTSLRYFGHKTTTGNTSLSLRTNYNLLVGVEGYSLVEKDTTPEEDHAHSFINGVCTVCGLSKKPYQRLTYFSVDVADENGNTYTDNAVLYLPTNYSPDGEPVKLILYCKQGGSTITSSSNPIEAVGFYNYLISLGYAVLGVDGVPDAWRDKLVLDETRVVGNPLAVQGTEAAYDYVIDNYNIAADGCFISGYSQGGHYAQNVIDLTDIPILAAAEQSPVCSIRYHQWDLSSQKTIGGVSVTRPARLNVARIYGFPGFTTNAELLDLAYDNTLVEEYDPWVRNSQNVYTGFVQKSNLWYLPEGTSLDGITMTHAAKCPVKIWCAEDDTAISADVMKVFVKAIQNAGGTAEISVVPTGGHGFFQKQTAVGSFTENGKSYKTLPIAVEIAQWFERYGGYACKHTYSDGTCTSCGETLDLAGKTISILGDSISTYTGVSNNTLYNSTIGKNAIYYTPGKLDIHQADTWWQQTIDAMGMELLVNNSWSGSCILHTRSSTVGAYVDRCVQLHNDTTNEDPDVIAVFMGTNDFTHFRSALGTSDINYDTLIVHNGDGTFTYATPTTSCEAYAIMLHKMTNRYPDAEIYCMTLLPRRNPAYSGTYAGQPTAFNTELADIIDHFGCKMVDLENCGITSDPANFDRYLGDKMVHPGPAGMDKMTEALISAMLGKEAQICSVSGSYFGTESSNPAATALIGGSYRTELTLAESYADMNVTVTMNGEEITAAAYADGVIRIDEVTGDIHITATAVKAPAAYRWELSGTSLISAGKDENQPVLQGGSVTGGVMQNAYYSLAEPVVLRHNLPWVVEFKVSGSWSGMILSAKNISSSTGNTYLFKTRGTNGLVAFGEYTGTQYENYGIALSERGVDTTKEHTYRVENRISENGSNMAYLLVDGVEYGAMDDYFIAGDKDQGVAVEWLSGRDLTFSYIGASGHAMNGCAIDYIQVWENGQPSLAGKTISILGASISTYAGTSNGAAADTTNSTIRGNAKYYPNSVVKDVTLNDTWWMQAAEDLGLRLLVNNSWSGSALLHERNGTVGAYVDRCVQLHDDTGDNAGEVPDIIGIQMGTNDFQYYKDTLGTADIDYAALIKANGDGSYSYSTPVTSLEAAAIVLHKISVRYPDAEVYYLNISQRVDGTDELIRSFNAELKQVVEHFGAHIVDIYGSAITMEKFDTYIGDGKVHPNRLGMDAYTEAFKKALLANTRYSVSTHVVSFDLTNAAADYGTDKTVVEGDAFRVGLTALEGQDLSVTVTMGGEDITAAVYQNGAVSIGAVTGDVVIRAVGAERTPRDYRWEFDGTDLVCVSGDNTLTKNAGTTTDGVFSQTRYGLETAVYLRHDKPWTVQWKCEGTFMNTGGSTGARIFTSTDVNAQYDARYIFKSNTNGIVAMGEKTTSGSHNYGIALAEYGIDWTQLHTYRLENRIAEDGSNMIWLFVDGVEIGPMNHYYVGTRDQNTTSDWLSGKDFVFPYMGTDTHGFSNAAIEYIAVWEAGHTHSYESAVTAPTCTEAGFTTYTCQCGESYVADYVDATGHNYENGTCIGCGATASPYLQQLPEDIVGCTNLYDSLVPVKGYYTATKYDTSNGAVLSVVIPVEPGDRIAASSFGAVSENMGSVNGIRVTYLLGDKIVTSLSAGEVYNGYTSTGYITVPDGVDTASIPWWVPSDSNWLTLSQISKDFAVHSPKPVSAQAPTCTEKGYTAGEICEVCNASLGEREEIPPTGHTYSEDACTVCGAVNLRAILDGKYVSILGDSISTFNGYSNDATVNTTIGGNGPRYDAGTADTKPGSYCLLESVDQTWWMHFANRSGMKLLVNNSWAGSQVFGGQTSDGRVIPAAYLDRCVNLHDNTLEDNPGNAAVCPDVIFVYLGINDYNFNRGKVGTGAVDYAGLVSSDGTYATPATFGEAYGIMLHKMRNAYPDAQIFAMTLLPENLYSVNKAAWEQHNSYIRAAAEYYDIPVVDLAKNCAITWENYSGYMIDKIHPTIAGMELISDCIDAELVSYYKENPPHTHSYVSAVTAPTCTEAGFTTYTCQCGGSYVADWVDAMGHTFSNSFCTVCGKQRNTTASPIDEGMFATVTPENYLTISNPTLEKLACAPGLVTYGDGKMAVAYLADDINTVETESSTTIVCRLGLFDLNSPQNGTFLDIATAGQTIGDVTIGQKAPYEPNLLVLEDGKLMVLFNIRDTSGNYIYFSAMVDPESKTVTDYTPLTLDGKTWNPANIAASYNAIADNSISSSGPSGSMVFTSQIVNHGGYYYGYCGGICAGFSGILVRSTDGVNWTSVMAPEALPEMAGVIECGFQFYDDYIYFCMRDISSGVYQCSYNLTAGEQMVRTHKLSNLTTSKPTAFTQNGKLYLIVNKATGDDATIGRRNTALFYEVDPAVCRLTLVRQIFCADGCAYHSVVNVNGTNYWAFHTDARRINPYTQGRSNLAFLAVPTLYSHTYESVVTAPTCTEQGYTTYTCTLCGDRYVDSYVEAVGHRYESNICIGCGKVKSGILNLTDYSHMYASGCITVAANVWQTGVVNYHYQIPLADFVSYNQVTVTANSTNKSYIAFFTQQMTKAGEILYADGWSEVLIMDPGATQTLKIPADAQYMYILNNNAAGDSLLPESVVFSCSHTYSDGICTGCGEKEPVSYTPGDITGDGEVNNKDLTRLFRYLSNYDVEIIDAALDVNGDGEINNKDLTRLFRYLSGHDVTIY